MSEIMWVKMLPSGSGILLFLAHADPVAVKMARYRWRRLIRAAASRAVDIDGTTYGIERDAVRCELMRLAKRVFHNLKPVG